LLSRHLFLPGRVTPLYHLCLSISLHRFCTFSSCPRLLIFLLHCASTLLTLHSLASISLLHSTLRLFFLLPSYARMPGCSLLTPARLLTGLALETSPLRRSIALKSD
ncbi:hypothetical protein PENTCL1PPCAC_1957, partial [Pristionchus entomophagus]